MNMLTNLRTLEISNVKKAANRKRYAFTKSEKEMDAKQVISVPAEGEAEFVATLKAAGADDKRIEAETYLYRLKKNFADVLKAEKPKKDDDGDDDDDDMKDGEEAKAYKARMKKKYSAKKGDITGVDPNFKPAHKSAELEPVFKAMSDKIAALEAHNEQLQYISKAEREFSHVPGSSSELAMVLKSAKDAGPAAEKAIMETLKKVNDFVLKNDTIMQSIGMSVTGEGQGDGAMAKIESLANQVTMKSESGKDMTHEQKIAHVISKTAEGRALYAQYNAERKQAAKNA